MTEDIEIMMFFALEDIPDYLRQDSMMALVSPPSMPEGSWSAIRIYENITGSG